MPAGPDRIVLNRRYSGSGTGLAKFFYVRDTRRAIGLGGFRLTHEMMQSAPAHPGTGVPFEDAVGLGSYNFDVKPGDGMGAANGGPRRLPGYMWNFTSNSGLSGRAAPFSFPLRALTVRGAPNVLAAGKTIAMTYAANTAAREHLDEWSCGVGAGAAAAMMAASNLTSAELLAAHVGALQARLRSPDIRQPLSWPGKPKPPAPAPPAPGGDGSYVCGAGRCFQQSGSAAAANGTYSNASCTVASTGRPACPDMAANEWLLLKAHWRVSATCKQATALVDTRLKKSELPASSLPAGEQRVGKTTGRAPHTTTAEPPNIAIKP